MLTAFTTVLGLMPMALGVSLDITQFRVLIGSQSSGFWGPMAIAGGLLLVRDLHDLVCLDLRDPAAKGGR